MKVNILWMCKECMHINRDLLQHLLWCELIMFMIYWPMDLSSALQVWLCAGSWYEERACLPRDWPNDLWQVLRQPPYILQKYLAAKTKAVCSIYSSTLQPQRMASMHHVHGEGYIGFIRLNTEDSNKTQFKKNLFHCDLYSLNRRCRNCTTWLGYEPSENFVLLSSSQKTDLRPNVANVTKH
jgi:hypothetical protein